jgi:hypothetical protein
MKTYVCLLDVFAHGVRDDHRGEKASPKCVYAVI